jgi:hypothetical protein
MNAHLAGAWEAASTHLCNLATEAALSTYAQRIAENVPVELPVPDDEAHAKVATLADVRLLARKFAREAGALFDKKARRRPVAQHRLALERLRSAVALERLRSSGCTRAVALERLRLALALSACA